MNVLLSCIACRYLKEFCDTEDYDYNRLRRYATKSIWSQQMNRSNTTPETASVIPLEVDSERGNVKSEVQQGII